jgi:hypothetical protein
MWCRRLEHKVELVTIGLLGALGLGSLGARLRLPNAVVALIVAAFVGYLAAIKLSQRKRRPRPNRWRQADQRQLDG